jgi:hypothetical protein
VVLEARDRSATTRIRFEGLTTSSRVKLLEVLFG